MTNITRLARLFVTLFCALSLTACMLLPTTDQDGKSSSVVSERRSLGQIRDDSTASYQIEQKIYAPGAVSRNSDISAHTFNDVVLLVGQAQNAKQRKYADTIAQNEKNIKRVYNEVTISPSITLLSHANDRWLTMKVYTEMMAKKGLKTAPIKVVTSDATVYLMGTINREQGKLAVDVTKKVSGVQRVVTIFDYTA